MNNKKGISAIVATVLIILITVAAVTIIWAAIIPMIKDNLSGSTVCFDASAALSVSRDYSCYNSSSNVTRIQVKRTTGNFDLVSLDIILGSKGTTKSFNQIIIPDVSGTHVYELNLSPGALNWSSVPDEASVSAVVKAGNSQKTCDAGGVVKIAKCA